MSKRNLLFVALILGGVSLSCTFLKDKLSKDSQSGTKIEVPASIPKFDPKAPLFSPGAEVVRRLAELDPSLGKFANAIETNERDAIAKSIAERQAASKTVAYDVSRSSAPPIDDIGAASEDVGSYPASAMLMFQGDGSELIVRDPALAGAMIGGLKNIWSESHTDAKSVGSVDAPPKTTTKNGVSTTLGGKLAFRKDGSSLFELQIKSESVQNGVSVTTEMSGSVDGDECPNADGQVQLTIKLRLAGESGGAQVAQDLTVFVRATVNDNADLVASTMDIVQGTRQVKNGRQMYIESGLTATDDFAPSEARAKVSNAREIRSSQNVHESMENLNEASDLAEDGYSAAYKAGLTVLYMARDKWQGGQCVQIVADSPGNVAVSSTTQIPVKVIHKFGGGDVPSKLDAALSGEASVDPATIPKTAGTLTYVAPGESGKSATIKLTATSKRGKATLDLNANTGGGSYQVVGGLDDFQTNTKVCDIMKPFTLSGGGFTNKFSGGLSGTYNFTGPFQSEGSGNYTISLPDGSGKPGTMTGQGTGSVLGGRFTRSGTEKYTLTPIEPCS